MLGTAIFAFDDDVQVYMLLKHDLQAIIDFEASLRVQKDIWSWFSLS